MVDGLGEIDNFDHPKENCPKTHSKKDKELYYILIYYFLAGEMMLPPRMGGGLPSLTPVSPSVSRLIYIQRSSQMYVEYLPRNPARKFLGNLTPSHLPEC
jgi:hypothetical protein